ncbi:hypothetical protein [Tenacibaculum soleae]|uniref:hypothetical protein n=1 Tax=Tenacibaculum soleae TaxID=447689 RepID=UPI0023010F31|nr:hypothetical protein [Tenacibaculum soleae]
MKRLKLLLLTLVTSITLTSCVVQDTDFSLNEYISSYDLWYIDYHRTTGSGDVSFLSKAFTVSFLNGTMYANNNIVDVGHTGNGLGIAVGDYVPRGTVLETYHDLDGNYNFEVVQLADDEIRIDDLSQNVSYYLIGYQRNNFNYDKLFNDNIEYFLQEYVAWERTATSGGTPNVFDDEHFLQFTPKNDVTFYSSHDAFGTHIDYINWDYEGGYQIDNISGFNNLKLLTPNYDGGDTEEFELSVINDERIQLFHLSSETTYTFSGRGFVQYLKNENKSITKSTVRNNSRKRTKIQRKTVDRKHLK